MKTNQQATVQTQELSPLYLFNMDEVSDLPQELKDNLNKFDRKKSAAYFVLRLFGYKDTLTSEEIMVGLYRGYGLKKNKGAIYTIVCGLKAKNLIRKIGPGTYQRCPD